MELCQINVKKKIKYFVKAKMVLEHNILILCLHKVIKINNRQLAFI